MKQFFSFFLALFLLSCGQSSSRKAHDLVFFSDPIIYASVFTIDRYTNYTVAEVKDPWDSTQILQRYILVDRNRPVPEGLPKGTILQVPLRKVVVYSSVHASIIDQLGETDHIIGVCEPQYMGSFIQDRIEEGKIVDLGESTAPNIEKIIDIGAEAIIASPFQNMGYGTVEKLGIPIIESADYMESLPLGRAEWYKFFGLLFDSEERAHIVFEETEQRYLALKELAANVEYRPTVISEKKYGAFWYIPGGDSYTAHFFKDAGVEYVFNYVQGAQTEPFSFETVLDEGIEADFWLMKYHMADELSYRDLRMEYTPYENFAAFKNKQIYTCNTGKVPYYDEFPIHPDYLLKDLIKIFHPELLPDYELRYYQPMKR